MANTTDITTHQHTRTRIKRYTHTCPACLCGERCLCLMLRLRCVRYQCLDIIFVPIICPDRWFSCLYATHARTHARTRQDPDRRDIGLTPVNGKLCKTRPLRISMRRQALRECMRCFRGRTTMYVVVYCQCRRHVRKNSLLYVCCAHAQHKHAPHCRNVCIKPTHAANICLRAYANC